MANAFGWDVGNPVENQKKNQQDILLSWEPEAPAEETVNQRALNDVLSNTQQALRQRIFDAPAQHNQAANDAIPAMTLVDGQGLDVGHQNQELDFRKALAPKDAPASGPQLSVSDLLQIEENGPGAQWMRNQRPDLAAKFAAGDCSMQLGFDTDGGASVIYSTADGTHHRQIMSKGGIIVDSISDPHRVIFSNSTSIGGAKNSYPERKSA